MKSVLATACLGRYTLHYDTSDVHAQIVSALSSDPGRLFAGGQPIVSPWQNAATDKTILTAGGLNYFCKRYNCPGFSYQLKNIFRQSRAMKSWVAGWKWLEAGLPTPRPVACMEERHLRLLGRSYLLLESIEKARSLLDGWAGLDKEMQRQVLVLLGTEIGRMHRQGLLHGDLNWRNILVREISGKLEVYFVDLDGCRFLHKVSDALAQKDMKHFYRDMQRHLVAEEDALLFRSTWQKSFRFR